MSQDLITVPEDQGVLEAIEVMRFKRVRRLPVVDAEYRLVGIATIDDFLEVLAEELIDHTRIVSKGQSHKQHTRR